MEQVVYICMYILYLYSILKPEDVSVVGVCTYTYAGLNIMCTVWLWQHLCTAWHIRPGQAELADLKTHEAKRGGSLPQRYCYGKGPCLSYSPRGESWRIGSCTYNTHIVTVLCKLWWMLLIQLWISIRSSSPSAGSAAFSGCLWIAKHTLLLPSLPTCCLGSIHSHCIHTPLRGLDLFGWEYYYQCVLVRIPPTRLYNRHPSLWTPVNTGTRAPAGTHSPEYREYREYRCPWQFHQAGFILPLPPFPPPGKALLH